MIIIYSYISEHFSYPKNPSCPFAVAPPAPGPCRSRFPGLRIVLPGLGFHTDGVIISRCFFVSVFFAQHNLRTSAVPSHSHVVLHCVDAPHFSAHPPVVDIRVIPHWGCCDWRCCKRSCAGFACAVSAFLSGEYVGVGLLGLTVSVCLTLRGCILGLPGSA